MLFLMPVRYGIIPITGIMAVKKPVKAHSRLIADALNRRMRLYYLSRGRLPANNKVVKRLNCP
jgi:hypothetical protein